MPATVGAFETSETTRQLGNNGSIKPMFSVIVSFLKLLGMHNDFLCRIFRTKHALGRPTIRSKLHLVHCIVLSLIMCLNAARVIYDIYDKWSGGLSTSLVSAITNSVLYIGFSYLIVTSLWTLSRELTPFLANLLHYEKIHGWVFNYRKLNLVFKFAFPFMLCCWSCATIIFITIIEASDKTLPVMRSFLTLKMFGIDDMKRLTFKVIWVFITTLIAGFINYLSLLTYCLVAYILHAEIRAIGNTIVKIDTISGNGFGNIRQIKAHLEDLLNLVWAFDSCIRHFIATLYAGTVIIICLTIYTNVQGTLNTGEKITELAYLSVMIFCISTTTVAAVLLSKKIHGPLNVLHQLDLSKMSEKDMHEISIFMSRLSGQSMGITIYGLFVLDQSSILAILGTILTYAIVMFQFQPSKQVEYENKNLLNQILETVNNTEMKVQTIVNGSLI